MLISCVVASIRPVPRHICSTFRSAATASRTARPAKPLPRSPSNIPKTLRPERAGLQPPKGFGSPAFIPTSVQQHRARQLYDAGIRQVYQARGSGRVIFSYVMGACFIGYAINLFTLRHWNAQNLKGMGWWQTTFVAGTNKIGMFLCSLAGGFIILRYSGMIRSIRLIETGHGTVKMDIHLRRRVPWSDTRYTVDPEDVLMPRHWQQQTIPDAQAESSRNLVAMLGKPYSWLKSWILMDGIVAPVRLGPTTAGQLDTRGTFSVSLNEFSDMTSEATL